MAYYTLVPLNFMREVIKNTREIYAPVSSSEVEARIGWLPALSINPPDDGLIIFFLWE